MEQASYNIFLLKLASHACLFVEETMAAETDEWVREDHEFSSVVLGHHTPWRIEGQKSGLGVLWMREAKDWNLWDGLGETYVQH